MEGIEVSLILNSPQAASSSVNLKVLPSYEYEIRTTTIIKIFYLCIFSEVLLPGLFAGFLDAGIQAILLQVWGPTKSRPLIQSFHFMYTIGAFLAPIIIAPFIEKANEDGSVEAPCPGTTKSLIVMKFELYL